MKDKSGFPPEGVTQPSAVDPIIEASCELSPEPIHDRKCALVEVPGLPYRVRSIADADEALEAFSRALSRYLHNFSEGEHSPRSLKIISTNSDRLISDYQIEQLEEVLGESLSGRSVVQSVVNHVRHQREHVERLEKLLLEVGVYTDEYGFKRAPREAP